MGSHNQTHKNEELWNWRHREVEDRSMASISLSVAPICSLSPSITLTPPPPPPSIRACSPTVSFPLAVSFTGLLSDDRRRKALTRQVVCMAPEGERLTRSNPLDFPSEWERAKPGRRSDIVPQFSPMKTPLPPPLPHDPRIEEEEEEEQEQEQEQEQELEEEEMEEGGEQLEGNPNEQNDEFGV